jgi:hypothetical protein
MNNSLSFILIFVISFLGSSLGTSFGLSVLLLINAKFDLSALGSLVVEAENILLSKLSLGLLIGATGVLSAGAFFLTNPNV